MEPNYQYDTITEAIQAFRAKGFTLDFNLEENCLSCVNGKFETDDFKIVEVFRYDGNTDPADEAVVYAIESSKGDKGILVASYGAMSDSYSNRMLAKLSMKQ